MLRCIYCALCVEACPTEAITMTSLFEMSVANRSEAIFDKSVLVVNDDGTPNTHEEQTKLTNIEETEDKRNERLEIIRLFETVDSFMEGEAQLQKQAYELLTEKDEAPLCDNGEFLWRLCKSTYLMAVAVGLDGNQTKKQELIFQSVDHGQRAIHIDDNSSEAHKWYAIALGSRGEYLGIKEKILDGFQFKKHIDKAAELAPQDHTIRHLLGRFCYEVAELSWWERKMAATLFADPPTASMEEAKDHFTAGQ